MTRPQSPFEAAPPTAPDEALARALSLAADEAAPRASADLQARILADFDLRARAAAPRRFAFKGLGRLIPAGALAALTAAGFLAGVATAEPAEEAAFDAEAAIAEAFAADAVEWTEI